MQNDPPYILHLILRAEVMKWFALSPQIIRFQPLPLTTCSEQAWSSVPRFQPCLCSTTHRHPSFLSKNNQLCHMKKFMSAFGTSLTLFQRASWVNFHNQTLYFPVFPVTMRSWTQICEVPYPQIEWRLISETLRQSLHTLWEEVELAYWPAKQSKDFEARVSFLFGSCLSYSVFIVIVVSFGLIVSRRCECVDGGLVYFTMLMSLILLLICIVNYIKIWDLKNSQLWCVLNVNDDPRCRSISSPLICER